MYSIFADGVCIYNDVFATDDMKVISPKLSLEDNLAGTFVMTLPPSNKEYGTISRLTSDISVCKHGQEVWAGRVLSESIDFWNNRVLTCEGELAFFNDTTQPPAKYEGMTIRAYLNALIECHNRKVPENRRFSLGAVTVYDDQFPDRLTSYEKTMELLQKLIEEYGGHFRVRKEDGVRFLDYLAEWPDTCTQIIQFGDNLIEFTRNWSSAEYATAIIPLGKRLNDSAIEELDAYLTVESVNEGKPYIQSDEAMANYGWIDRVVRWDDVEDPAVLLEKGKEYLKDIQFDNLELELSALDLHYLNPSIEAVKLLDEIRVISRPHGLDRLFPVTKLEIPLDSPEQTQFRLGDTVKTSLTGLNNQTNSEILKEIEDLPKAHSILKEAKENATHIMNMATTGFITITKDDFGSDTLYISNVRDYNKANKLWKWNMNGLGYSNDGGKTFGLAITMDGAIVADYITAGVLNADVIRIGILRDYGSNTVFDLNEGTLTMKKGSISLGQYFDDNGRKNYNFTVDNDGNLYARRGTFAGTLSAAKGTFGGQLVAATGNFKGVVQAEDFLDTKGNSMMNNGKFKGDYLDLMGIHVVNNSGVTVMTIDQEGIRFGRGFSPVKYRYAVSASGPWHDKMESGDKFRQESVDGGETWGDIYQFVGTDGAPGSNGSDASVTYNNIKRALEKASSLTTAFMKVDEMGAPKIYGAKIYGTEIYAGGLGEEGGQVIGLTDGGIDIYDGGGIRILTIKSDGSGGVSLTTGHNYLAFNTPYINFENTVRIAFKGKTVDFTGVSNVKGLHATFA